MFQPTIYITHKLLRQIVTLELADAELKYKYKTFSDSNEKTLVLDIFKSFERDYGMITHSDKMILDHLSGKSDIEELRAPRNAVQAVNAFEQSLRAEDDWNLMLRINKLLNKDNLSIQNTNIRGKEPNVEHNSVTLHTFENADQVEHFVLELLRWYRKSENEANKYLRFLTLIYHLLKVYPFHSYNFSTILFCSTFWIRENELSQVNLIPLASALREIENQDCDINEFIQTFVKRLRSETRKVLFEFEKKALELSAPKKILNLNHRQIELLKILQTREKITRSDAAEILEVSFMTAYRDLKGLVKKRLLVENGVGRATHYILASK